MKIQKKEVLPRSIQQEIKELNEAKAKKEKMSEMAGAGLDLE